MTSGHSSVIAVVGLIPPTIIGPPLRAMPLWVFLLGFFGGVTLLGLRPYWIGFSWTVEPWFIFFLMKLGGSCTLV